MGTAINPYITNLTSFILFATIPFNLLKSLLSSVITFLIYKKLSGVLHR
jgi:riboflavin transporter FmnP